MMVLQNQLDQMSFREQKQSQEFGQLQQIQGIVYYTIVYKEY